MHRRLVVLAALALVAVGCLYYYKLEVPDTMSWSATGLTSAGASSQNGTITVVVTTDTVVSALITRRCYGRNRDDAEAHIDEIVITDTIDNGRLLVEASAPSDPRNYGADFEISLPAALRLDLRTSNGAISVAGVQADLAIHTSNGAVSLTGTTGTATVGVSNGKVTLAVHTGSVGINTSNGAVDCDLARLDPTGHANIRTSNGVVTLRLPVDVSARFDLTTSNGDITIGSGFGIVSYVLTERTHKTGTIGSGAAEITVTTSNGSITLLPR